MTGGDERNTRAGLITDLETALKLEGEILGSNIRLPGWRVTRSESPEALALNGEVFRPPVRRLSLLHYYKGDYNNELDEEFTQDTWILRIVDNGDYNPIILETTQLDVAVEELADTMITVAETRDSVSAQTITGVDREPEHQ